VTTVIGGDDLAREIELLAELLEAGADRNTLLGALGRLRTRVEEVRVVDEELAEQAEELITAHQLVESERRRYEDLFAAAPTAYLVTDLHGTITQTNAASAELLGVPQRFLEGKPFSAFVSLPQRREFRRMLMQVGPRPMEAEYRFERRGGIPFDATVTIAPMFHARSQQIEALRWAIRDVTDERQAERRLWELNAELEERVGRRTADLQAAYDALSVQRAQFEAIVHNLPVAVVVAHPDGRVQVRNSRADELFGSAVERLDTLTERLVDLEGRPLSEPLTTAEVDGQGALAPFAFERPNGDRVLLEATRSHVQGARGHRTLVFVFHDVTEQRRRDVAQREFVVNAAHELRTPLAAIVSAIEVLQAGGKDDVETRDIFLTHLERESHRLVRLARSLLLLSRAQARDEHPQRELVPLRQLLEDVAVGLRPAQDVLVEVDCNDDVAALVNEDLLRQALTSLGENAARYTQRGTITLRARPEDELRVAVEVVDTGPGLSDEERTLVTHRFVRGARSSDGFGLGLAIASEAARGAGGELELESKKGRGTTARIVVQLARLVAV
jgi:PAS domain S-box-containing protein